MDQVGKTIFIISQGGCVSPRKIHISFITITYLILLSYQYFNYANISKTIWKVLFMRKCQYKFKKATIAK